MYKFLIYATAAICALHATSLAIAPPQWFYYAWMGLIAVIMLFHVKKINAWTLLLLGACVISIVFNDIPAFFQPWSRLGAFAMLLMAYGSLFRSEYNDAFRYRVFKFTNYGVIAIVVASFIGYLVGAPGMISSGYVCGYANHSMTLSSLGAIATLVAIYFFMHADTGKKKWLSEGLIVCSALICLLGGSRAAFVSAIGGSLFYLWVSMRGRITKFLKYLTIILVLVAAGSPFWYPYTENMRTKMENNEKMGGQTASRDALWETRWDEFESSPLIGIGFASVDPHKNAVNSKGGIEPGTSWLFILSSIGILGMICFCFIYFPPLIKMSFGGHYFPDWAILVGAMSVTIGLQMVAEGFILAAGDFISMYAWLVIGLMQFIGSYKFAKPSHNL